MKKRKLTDQQEDNDKITYSESVRVNIGDYESRDVFASFSTTVKRGENVDEAFDRSCKHVQDFIKKKERHIRQTSEADTDFETMDRLNYYKTKKKTKR